MSGLRMLCVAVAFSGGIGLADVLQPASATATAAGAAGAICLMAAAALHSRNPYPTPGTVLPSMRAPTIALAAAGVMACGFCSLGLRLASLADSTVVKHEGEKLQLTGRLAGDPRPSEYSTRFFLAVRAAGGKRVREKVAVSAYGPLPDLALGDLVQITAKIKRLDLNDHHDAFLARKSVVAKASVSGPDVRRIKASRNPALAAANHFRSRTAEAARAGAPEPRAGLVLALAIGDQRTVPAGVSEDFRAAGLSHLSAVSGQNVALVMVPLILLLSALRLSRGARMAISLIVLVLFAVVTRWEPSVLRAVLMASAALSAWFFGRRSDALHLLGLVLFVLLAVDPLVLWSIGFQLSFAATAGILLLGPHLSSRLGRPFFSGAAAAERGATPPAGPGLRGRLVQATAIGIAAQVAVLPLIALHFGRITLVSLPANLMALPFVAPVTVLGLFGGLIALVSVEMATPIMFVAGLFASALEATARLFGGSAYAEMSVDGWSLFHFSALCLGPAAAGLWLGGKGRAARWPAVVGLLSAVMAGLAPAAGSARLGGMRLTFFDVGQGDAALIQSPSGARVLVDGGPDAGYLAGRLKAMGLSRLDLVVASHGHRDHVEGLGQILTRFKVRAAVDPGIPTGVMQGVAAEAHGSNRAFSLAGENHTVRIGDLTIDFLAPAPWQREAIAQTGSEGPGAEGSALNDASLVARVSFGGQCALFAGDLEIEGQRTLLGAHPHDIDCTILKAPHHGSGRLVPEFVRKIDPEWVTISAGTGNDYGHPAPAALGIFGDAGARVLRTDRMGDIILEIDGNGRVTLRT